MAQLPSGFNADNYDDMNEFVALPAGEYEAKIKQSEMVDTKKGDGQMLKLTLEICSGQYSGRLIWTNLNLINPNEQTVEMAHKELATICRACGKVNVDDSEELHGIPMTIKLKLKPETKQYPASNTISNYKPLAGLARPTSQTAGNIAKPMKPTSSTAANPARPAAPLVQFDE